MNKKVLILPVAFLLSILSSFIVYAQDEGMLDLFKGMGKFLFEDLPALGDLGFKFLLWIALFALIHYGLKKAFDNKTAGIIAFVLSLLTVLLMPKGVVQHIFATYTVIVVLALGVFVPILLVWVVHKMFGDADNLGVRLLKAVTYFVIAYALFSFTQWVKSGGLVITRVA